MSFVGCLGIGKWRRDRDSYLEINIKDSNR
jgi:hypothetical protein